MLIPDFYTFCLLFEPFEVSALSIFLFPAAFPSFLSIFRTHPQRKRFSLDFKKRYTYIVILFTLFTLFNNFAFRKVYSLHVALLLDFLILIFQFLFRHSQDIREETDAKSCTKRILKDSQR